MKKTLIALSLLAVANASYAVGTIRFLGEVSDQTCEIEIESVTGDLNILLDPVTVTDLTNAGVDVPLGKREFSARVFNCTGTTMTEAGVKLVPTKPNPTNGKYLANILTTNAASNVALQLYDETAATSRVLDFTSGADYVTTPWTSGATEKTFKLSVAYVMTATPPGTGQLQSNIQYTVTYK